MQIKMIDEEQNTHVNIYMSALAPDPTLTLAGAKEAFISKEVICFALSTCLHA